MHEDTFHLLIQTPEATLYNGEASRLSLGTETGEIEILPRHAHLVSTVTFALPKVTVGNKEGHNTEHMFAIRHGSVYFDTEKNHCRVLAFWGQKREEIVHETIAEYLKFVEEKLANHESLNSFQIKYLTDQKESLDEMISVTVNKK